MNDILEKKVKTIYIDTGDRHSAKSALLGVVFLFLCVFLGVLGIIWSVADSFNFDIGTMWIARQILICLLFFTVIYFLPSRLFTVLALLGGGSVLGLYVWRNLDDVIFRANAALNWCLYQISLAGYNIGPLLDRELARTVPHEEYLIIFTFAIILLSGIFTYLIYSRKSVFYNLIISIALIFPGFFYGLIPAYLPFALITAFWVANFAVNIFDSDYIRHLIYKQEEIPPKTLAKIKLREFKKEQRKSIKNIKSEIKTVARLPNPDDNTLRLERLLRQLETYKKPSFLFMSFYGLNKLKLRKSPKKKRANLIKDEKKILKIELRNLEKAEKAAHASEIKAFKSLPFSKRLKRSFEYNFKEKKKFFARSGFNAMAAFIVALAIVMIAQTFISPDTRFSRMRAILSDELLTTLTTTIEHALVGSDARVYGGHSGGMGGGNLYRTGGVSFRHIPILEIDLTAGPQILSNTIYLRGFVGSIYDGRRWIEADRRYIQEFDNLMQSHNNLFGQHHPETFFRNFMDYMHGAAGVLHPRRRAELVRDRITVQHLVSGGRLVFTPHFMDRNSLMTGQFRTRQIADLTTHVTNSIFRQPRYTMEFYSTDWVLGRDYNLINLRDYLERYARLFEDISFWSRERILAYFSDVQIMNAAQIENFIEDFYAAIEAGESYYEGHVYENYFGVTHLIAADGTLLTEPIHTIVLPIRYVDIVEFWQQKSGLWHRTVSFEFLWAEVLYYNFVRSHFLQLPYDLPQEIGVLAREVTQYAQTPFDKALALEYFLSTTFPYTLSPRSPINPDADFVYSFLFDVQEGYCTYYATAMTVMLRTLGIPAREVEGFLVDTRQGIRRDEDGYPEALVILDSNAHAWVEVYMRGIGWIPFEPTASAYIPEEEDTGPNWVPPSRLPGIRDNGWAMDPGWYEWDPYEFDWYDNGYYYGDSADLTNLIVILSVILPIILFILAIYFINREINKRRIKFFKTADTNDATIKMLAYIFRFLKLCGFAIQSDEGLTDFAQRIALSFPMMRSDGWVNFMRIMQKARYSVHDISERERAFACKFIEELREECLKSLTFGLKFKLRFVRFVI